MDFTKEKLKSSEENMTLVIHEKEKQTSEFTSFKNANEDLKVQLHDLDRKLKETETKCRANVDKVNDYESAECTAKVIDVFRASMEYQDELFEKSNSLFDWGCAHILHQFHQYILGKTLMCQTYEGSYIDPSLRNDCDFIPFTEDELKEIADSDRRSGDNGIHLY